MTDGKKKECHGRFEENILIMNNKESLNSKGQIIRGNAFISPAFITL
jgi:hypothetical protein